jgi:hypothetical protein
MKTKNIQFRRGMTLMEALMASTLLSMGASAVLLPFNVGAQSEQEDARRTLALYLGREMMEEAISKPFDDPEGSEGLGPDSGETSRSQYDNIDDYDGYEDGYDKTIDQIVGIDGQTIDGLAAEGLQREVVVEYVHVSGQDVGDDPNFVSVVVKMKYMGDILLELRRLVHKPQ